MAQQGIEAIAAATGSTPAEQHAAISKGLPLGRMVRPEEVASLATWLAGPDAGSITGQSLTMSSGDL
jgi:NAD(P)-dependent dehydrogenase (short-subunit alcohol dehydrogenase family)